jgi:c-di-GMP-binding flagellar brake protein YcgR
MKQAFKPKRRYTRVKMPLKISMESAEKFFNGSIMPKDISGGGIGLVSFA